MSIKAATTRSSGDLVKCIRGRSINGINIIIFMKRITMPRFWATGCGCNVSKCNSATFINSARGRGQGQGQGQEEEETRSYFCITLILFFPLLSSSLHPRPLPRHLVILTGSKALVRHAEPGVQFSLLVPTTTHTRSLYHESKGFRFILLPEFSQHQLHTSLQRTAHA